MCIRDRAYRKRQETGVLQVKTHSLEHEHILSGIIKCPVCGSGMYGNVNRKKYPDGGHYKDYFYYACKHRKLVDGHRCTYKRQWNEDRINACLLYTSYSKKGNWIRIQLFGNSEQLQMMEKYIMLRCV